jgi:HEAT repeat protein
LGGFSVDCDMRKSPGGRRGFGAVMPKRLVWLALLLALTGGCKKDPPQSGGRTAEFWAQVLQEPDVEQRRKAATKLGPLILTDPAALPALLVAVKDADAGVRAAAAWSLGIYSGPKSSEVLPVLQELEKDKEAKVRAAATQAIKDLSNH